MTSISSGLAAFAAMATFVLLWGSAAIFTRWGLDHASVLAFLVLRYALALVVLLAIGVPRGRWLPQPGTRLQVAGTGLLLIGVYSACYFQAMAHGITPGLIATVLGVQPILTLLATERSFPWTRLAGLVLALAGLALVVFDSLVQAKLSGWGMAFALAALACMTVGAMLQKRIHQSPGEVLPLQYAVTLLLYACLLPWQPFRFEADWNFWIPLLWLGLVISVGAQLLLYRLIRQGNLVNVTSLFYLVPAVTVVLDFLVLGNAMPALSLVGMAAIVAGVVLAFRSEGGPGAPKAMARGA